ncbi:MAG: twin-arginine translocation signal domain-containing protein, partial [Thermoguttaceae bacterium]|nr:twin-arginine translocation signal domain-containing protein [Thermoguttaceae bacterium]
MKQVTRRDFFKTSAVAAAMATAVPVVSAPKPIWAQAP